MSLYSVIRLYESAQNAHAAVAALEGEAFAADLISIVVPPGAGASEDSVVATIAKGQVLKAEARHYAGGVLRGLTLVSVRPPFGWGAVVEGILDAHAPADYPDYYRGSDLEEGEAAPFSTALGIPVLATPAVGTHSLGIPLLANPSLGDSRWGLPLLSKIAAPLSALFHLPTLSAKAAPLSSAFGLPTLSKSAAPLSAVLGLPLLTRPR